MVSALLHILAALLLAIQTWFAVPALNDTAQTLPIWATTTAEVTHVIDGDTIDVRLPDGNSVRVRYIGMNTPEIYPALECGGKEAADRNRELVAGKSIQLVPGPGLYDKYKRRLAYVSVGTTFVNEVLVQEGLADLMMIPPNTAFRQQFEREQAFARSKKVGMWSCGQK
jgi:micrococcal nuclease